MPGREYPYTVRSNSINNSRYQAAMNSGMVKKCRLKTFRRPLGLCVMFGFSTPIFKIIR